MAYVQVIHTFNRAYYGYDIHILFDYRLNLNLKSSTIFL